MLSKWHYKGVRGVIDTIIDDIVHLPKGYIFWFSLGERKRAKIRIGWTKSAIDSLIPIEVRDDLVDLVLDENGIPIKERRNLYIWCVMNIYGGIEKHLYQDWDRVRRKKEMLNGN